MIARLLRPRAEPKIPAVGPKCVGLIVGPQPLYRHKNGPECLRLAQYELDGKPYCAFHAGRIALDALLKAKA